MGNPFGRLVVLPLTNKSGGGVVAGDVVIVDTANNDAFTTTTTGAFTGPIGIAQQTIGSNSVGLVLVEGYAALVNVNASVTRGHFAQTHTVAKQASDAGTSRQAGTFGIFLTGGTTPDALIWQPDLGGGSGMTNPMTTKGDVIIGDTGGTPSRLAAGATAGMVLTSAGSAAFETFSLPPGYEYSYVEGTSPVTISATSEATADTIVTAGAISFDGSTVVLIEFYASDLIPGNNAASDSLSLWLYDGSSSIGQIAFVRSAATQPNDRPCYVARRLTPSNASHTYSIRGSRLNTNATVNAGTGGSGTVVPLFIRITKV